MKQEGTLLRFVLRESDLLFLRELFFDFYFRDCCSSEGPVKTCGKVLRISLDLDAALFEYSSSSPFDCVAKVSRMFFPCLCSIICTTFLIFEFLHFLVLIKFWPFFDPLFAISWVEA